MTPRRAAQRLLMLAAVTVAFGWLATACGSTTPAPAANANTTPEPGPTPPTNQPAANNDPVVSRPEPNANANVVPAGMPTELNPFEYDGFGNSADSFFEGLVTVLQSRGLRTLHVPKTMLPARRDLVDRVDSPVAWIVKAVAFGHYDDYMIGRASQLDEKAEQAVINPPAMAEVIAEEFRDELTKIIFASQTDMFDPATSAELGKYQTAQAVLFTKLEGSFKSLRQFGIMTRGKYWVRGHYKIEARLVLTEKATKVWTNSFEWDKYFVVSEY